MGYFLVSRSKLKEAARDDGSSRHPLCTSLEPRWRSHRRCWRPLECGSAGLRLCRR